MYVRVNQQNEALGKVGLAVIKNDEKIRLILYRTKQIVLSTLSLQSTSIVYNKQDYVQYQDDNHSFWSLRFEVNDRETFLKTIDQHCTVEDEPVEEPTLKHDATIIADNKKVSIVNRMAKMGHQLPQVRRSIELPDAEIEEVKDSTSSYRPVVPKWKPDIPSREMFPYAGTSNTNTPILASSTLISYNPNMMTAESGINSFLAENRIQNSEVRMNISKLETKIERVMDKIDALNMERQPRRKIDSEDEILRLEEKILELKKENRQFRLSIEELKEHEHKQQINGGDAERLETANRRNTELQIALDSKVAEVKRLGSEILDQSTRFEALKRDLSKLQTERFTETAAKSAELEVLRKQLDAQAAEFEDKFSTLEASLASRMSEISMLKSQGDKERDELTSKIQALNKRAEKVDQSVGDTVKEIMNNLYQKLQDQLTDRGELGAQEVLKITRILIKKETNAALSMSTV